MKRANGPSSLHSPFSAPGLDSRLAVEFIEEIGVEVSGECLRVDAAMYERVGEKTISTISAGNEWAVGVGSTTSSGDIILAWEAGRAKSGTVVMQRKPALSRIVTELLDLVNVLGRQNASLDEGQRCSLFKVLWGLR